jgi:RNA polymerase sigma factor (sigma-70 family)
MYRSDSVLIQACLSGNEIAWKELVQRYSRLVYSVALRDGLSATDADDVFQNVFIIAFRHLRSLRDHKLLAAWLIRITHRECLRFRKQESGAEEISDDLADSATLPDDKVATWEFQHHVHLALAQMDALCRQLMKALFLDPHQPSYQEIARRLQIPVGSIGPTRARCFKKLEAVLVAMGIELD